MIRRFAGPGTTALALALSCGAASAHHPGSTANSGGAGPINTLSATTLEQGRFAASVTYEMIKIDAFSDAELAAYSGADQHVHGMDRILAPALGLAYGVTNDLMVSFRLPYVKRSDIREAAHHHEEHGHGGHEEEDEQGEVVARGDSAGIGDLTVLGQYRFLANRASGTELAAIAGFKAPTGRTGVRDQHGEEFEAEFQPGSGAWDGLFGLAATQRFGAVSLDAHVLYILTGEGTLDTDLGDRLHYGVALSYRIFGGARMGGPMYAGAHSHSHPKGGSAPHHHEEPTAGPALDLVLELNGEWSDNQEIAGVTDPNSGGHTLYVSPGARLSMGAWSGFASLGIPIVNNLDGIQAEPDWRLLTGLSVGF
jgi:hypothetical protein